MGLCQWCYIGFFQARQTHRQCIYRVILDLIHTELVGIGNTLPSMIVLFSQVAIGSRHFIGPEIYESVKAQYDYFNALQTALFGIVLLVLCAAMMINPFSICYRDLRV